MEQFYFSKYETRKPYNAVPENRLRTWLFQFCAVITILLGGAYLHWRWFDSLNPDAMWFAVPLVVAESLSYIGTVLMIFNLWSNKDPVQQEPPHFLSDIEELNGREDRPLKIDIMIASYNEEVELVRYSIRDAKKVRYPYKDVELNVYLLDDGRRDGRDPEKENMKKVCEEEGVHYLCREDNIGFKAGNLRNALEQTSGDLFAIMDADTRPFSSFLESTAGYFRDKKVAWVQTPQWFYDVTEPVPFSAFLKSAFNLKNKKLRKAIELLFGGVKIDGDIFGNDPRMFYEVILRRRNNYNAAFCCGAGSIHRREAVMSLAIKDFIREIDSGKQEILKDQYPTESWIQEELTNKLMIDNQLKPFKYHASEDIYTSMMMHCDDARWKSIQHPQVECKMLSPQDLDSCVKQRTRYASGSLDIAIADNPLWIKGLDPGQRIAYLNTIYSYFSPIWIIIFLISPIVFFFTLELPVKAFSLDFFKYFISFQLMNTLTFLIGTWGVSGKRGEQYYIASFWLIFRSIISAIKREKVKFNVTPKSKQVSNNLQHIQPHILIIGLTIAGIIFNVVLLLFDQHPSLSGFVTNSLWSFYNVINLGVMIIAAYWNQEKLEEEVQYG